MLSKEDFTKLLEGLLQVRAAIDDLTAQIRCITDVPCIAMPSRSPTFAQLYEEWSVMHFKKISASGIYGYRTGYKHLTDIKDIEIDLLKTRDYQSCIDLCGEYYTRSVCEKMKQVISQVCKYAMMNDYISKNYAEFLILPHKPKKEKQIFSNDEIKILWQHTEDNRVRMILFLIYTGFRLNELFTITKDNVHIDKGYIIGGIKTEAGRNRLVPVTNDKIVQFVKLWLNTSPNQYLCRDDASNFRKRRFYPCLAELGIISPPTYDDRGNPHYKSHLTPHCCRHTFASIAVKSGIAPEVLRKIMGHSNYSTTVTHYIHTDTEQLIEGMNKFHI